ncbi:MAG: hypothetical protein CL678_18060 [Bdellovibrionaceae bacterium]|nr:hypothetical protein [Pseudobdellovibrionaceae bacterium]|tara:strand:+ start:1395 stop:1760 length:366 start_codon:yes stop_codon:yes gene_type:complete
MSLIDETEVNIISEGTKLEGNIHFDKTTRVHGVLIGDVTASENSRFILGETAVVEGNIEGDYIFIDGYVRGDIHALSKVTVSATGRVLGNINAPSVEVKFGAYFDGKCYMNSLRTATASLE